MTTKTVLTCDWCGAIATERDRERWGVLHLPDKLTKDTCAVCVDRLRNPVNVSYRLGVA